MGAYAGHRALIQHHDLVRVLHGGSCLQLVGVYLLAAACAYIQSNLMAQLAQKGCNKLRSELFDKLQQLPLSFFDAHTHGELMIIPSIISWMLPFTAPRAACCRA